MLLFSKVLKKAEPTKPYEISLESLAGINSIPVPLPKNVEDGNMLYYRLQRKATEHKKAGKIDLAIACLWKSIQLSDYAFDQTGRPLLLEKEYYRVVKYIHLKGNLDEEQQALNFINKRHPEFSDKRISSKRRFDETLAKCREYKTDLVYISSSRICPLCSIYDNKIFSISGNTIGYPILPDIIRDGGPCKEHFMSSSPSFKNIIHSSSK